MLSFWFITLTNTKIWIEPLSFEGFSTACHHHFSSREITTNKIIIIIIDSYVYTVQFSLRIDAYSFISIQFFKLSEFKSKMSHIDRVLLQIAADWIFLFTLILKWILSCTMFYSKGKRGTNHFHQDRTLNQVHVFCCCNIIKYLKQYSKKNL